MGRAPCCAKVGLHKGPWTAKEDALLTNYIRSHGEGNWRTLPAKAGLLRCGKSCRLRWVNYLRPDVKRGNIAPEEEDLIIRLHALLGNRWSLIAGRLPGRTDNEIKNFWNTHLSKKLKSLGADTRQGISEAAPRRSRANSHKRSRNKNHSHHNHQDKRESKINEIRDGGEATRNKIYCPKPTRLAPIITKPKVMEGSSNSMDETENTTSEQDKGNNNIQNSDGGTLQDMDGTNNVEDFELPSRDDLLFESLFQEYLQLLNSEGDELQLQTSFAESLPA